MEQSNETRFSNGGYFCPICDSKYCELPVECKVCGKQNFKLKKKLSNLLKIFLGLTLVMAPHLARSYHHLFPLEPFVEVNFILDDNSDTVSRSE